MNIAGTTFTLEYYSPDSLCALHTVAIFADGTFWDHREFMTEQEARSYMADPFARERKEYQAKERAAIERDEMAERNASLIGCNRGRQVGPNKRGSM